MLCHFRAMGPNALWIVLVGNSNLKDGQSPSLDDMHLDCEALSFIHQAITFEVFKSISSCSLAHDAWTKIEDIYGGSNLHEDNILFGELMEEFSTFLNHEELSIASTSDYLHTSTSFTSPTCGIPQEEINKDEACLIDEESSSPKESSSTPCVHMCLMARGNDEVSSSLSDNEDSCNEEDDEVLT